MDISAYRSGFSTIPSKYSTQVVLQTEKGGFDSKATRFQEIHDDTPGPGSYSAYVTGFTSDSPSYGQRGTGSFASRSKRMPSQRRKQNGPAPSSYNVVGDVTKRKDFSSQNSACFQKPLAVDRSKRRMNTRQPAPNQYNLVKYLEKSSSSPAIQSSFKSKTARYLEKPLNSGSNVSPAKYDPVPVLKKETSVTCFKSKVTRVEKQKQIETPGPGSYDPDPEAKRPTTEEVYSFYPRKHGLLISAPAMPMPKTPQLPGPGAYEVGTFKPESKAAMSSAAFKSGTSRLTHQPRNGVPGPGHYQPKLPKPKTSYYFRVASDNKWIGI